MVQAVDSIEFLHESVMARIARVVVPGYPHHVTQRGNRKQETFFEPGDYRAYLRMVSKARIDAGAEVWGYCLMPNHVHLVVVPERHDSLAMLFQDAHRRYTRRINAREGWCGHLWQERFHSFPMDETHLLAAVRYVELNPVRAGLCEKPTDWRWSSVHAHIRGDDDLLVTVKPMLDRTSDWLGYLSESDASPDRLHTLRKHSRTGRPAGDERFVATLEDLTGRRLRKLKTGPRKDN